jgi:hypothetical protein
VRQLFVILEQPQTSFSLSTAPRSSASDDLKGKPGEIRLCISEYIASEYLAGEMQYVGGASAKVEGGKVGDRRSS